MVCVPPNAGQPRGSAPVWGRRENSSGNISLLLYLISLHCGSAGSSGRSALAAAAPRTGPGACLDPGTATTGLRDVTPCGCAGLRAGLRVPSGVSFGSWCCSESTVLSQGAPSAGSGAELGGSSWCHQAQDAHHGPGCRMPIKALGAGCPSRPQGQVSIMVLRMIIMAPGAGCPSWPQTQDACCGPEDRVPIVTRGQGAHRGTRRRTPTMTPREGCPSRSQAQDAPHDPEGGMPNTTLGTGYPSQPRAQEAHHGPGHRVPMVAQSPRQSPPPRAGIGSDEARNKAEKAL